MRPAVWWAFFASMKAREDRCKELWDQLNREARRLARRDPAAYVDRHIRKTIRDVWRAYESMKSIYSSRARRTTPSFCWVWT